LAYLGACVAPLQPAPCSGSTAGRRGAASVAPGSRPARAPARSQRARQRVARAQPRRRPTVPMTVVPQCLFPLLLLLRLLLLFGGICYTGGSNTAVGVVGDRSQQQQQHHHQHYQPGRRKTDDIDCRSPPALGHACAATRCEVAVEALCGHRLHDGSCNICDSSSAHSSSNQTLRAQLRLAGCTDRYVQVLCAANASKSAKQFMTEVFDVALATGPRWATCRRALAAGNFTAALDEWRDQTVLLLAQADLLEFQWHSNIRAIYNEGPVRVMVGNITQADSFAAIHAEDRMPAFVDLVGISEGNFTHPIAANRWFCNVSNETLWPRSWPFGCPHGKAGAHCGSPRHEGLYGSLKGWEQFASLAWASNQSRYWRRTYIGAYIEHVRELFQAHFALFFLREKERYDVHPSYCGGEFGDNTDELNWNPEDNHLQESSLAHNWIQTLALLAKTTMSQVTEDWEAVLRPAPPGSTLLTPEDLPADALSQMVEAFLDSFHYVVLPFATSPNSVPNQASTGILGMMWIGNAFSTTKKGALIKSAVDAALERLLDDMAEPDGGLLEQSFNYHMPVLQLFTLRASMNCSLVSNDVTSLQQCEWLAARCRAALDRNAVLQASLLSPTGNQPQVGNNAEAGCSTFDTKNEKQRCNDVQLGTPTPAPATNLNVTSVAYPWTGYYVQRDSWERNASWLFFYPVVHPRLSIPRGHINAAANSIQVTAHGRQLFVSGGAPTYGRPVPVADYLSEQSVLKHCTVAPLNSSGVPAEQAFPGQHDGITLWPSGNISVYEHAGQNLMTETLWGTFSSFDISRSSYAGGYVGIWPSDVAHTRTVIFVRPARIWLVIDDLNASNLTNAQIWPFAPPGNGGFARSDVDLSAFASSRVIRTVQTSSANVELHVSALDASAEKSLAVRAFNGSMSPAQLGWYGPGIGSWEPKTDVHIQWSGSTPLVTAIVPVQPNATYRPIAHKTNTQQGDARGVSLALHDGGAVYYRQQLDGLPRPMAVVDGGTVMATATTVVSYSGGTAGGVVQLLVLGCTQMAGVPQQRLRSPNFVAAVDGQSGALVGPPEYIFDPIAPIVRISSHGECNISALEGFEIRYSLDESDPTAASGSLYTAPFSLPSAANVRARYFDRATGTGLLPVGTATYSPAGNLVYRRVPDATSSDGLAPGVWFWAKPLPGYARAQQAARTICYRANFSAGEEGTTPTVTLRQWRGQTDQLIRFSGLLEIPSESEGGIYEVAINTSRTERAYLNDDSHGHEYFTFFGGDADVFVGYEHTQWDLRRGLHRFHALLHLRNDAIVDDNVLIWRRLERGGSDSWSDWHDVPAQSLWREHASPCRPNYSVALPVYK
jgi:hypothetical protein